jgi:hypothetical protein
MNRQHRPWPVEAASWGYAASGRFVSTPTLLSVQWIPLTPDGQQREALAILLKFPSGYQVSYSTGALQTGAQSGKQVPANGHDNPAPGPSFESEVNEQSDRARASSDQK